MLYTFERVDTSSRNVCSALRVLAGGSGKQASTRPTTLCCMTSHQHVSRITGCTLLTRATQCMCTARMFAPRKAWRHCWDRQATISDPVLGNFPPTMCCCVCAAAGSLLGLCILAFTWVWSGLSTQVGAAVAIALPVSTWSQASLCNLLA